MTDYLTDPEFQIKTIERVERSGDGGWSLYFSDGTCFFCPAYDGEPKPWDFARLFGRGFGYTVRGLVIAGRVVYYRTAEQDEDRRVAEAERARLRRIDDYEARRSEYEALVAALPQEFQRRIAGFRLRDGWRAEFEPYELMVCCDAVKIAAAHATADVVRAFGALKWDEQKRVVPGLDDGHSGNSFGAAVRLAWLYKSDPALVEKEHGALCPLVGCAEYGCWSTRAKEETKA